MKKAVILLIVILMFSVFTGVSYGQFFKLFQNPLIGKEAPDAMLRTREGLGKTISEIRDGRKAILFFWATWCPNCRREIASLNKKKKEFAKNNLVVIYIDLGENPFVVERYVEKNNVKADIYLDQKSELSIPYGITGIPTFFYIDEKGIILEANHMVPDNYMKIFK